MSFYSVAQFIKDYYPQYWGEQEYPANNVAVIHKVAEQWGILSNFAPTPIAINEVTFKNAEQLFQCMKFLEPEPLLAVYNSPNPKMSAKKWERSHRREDWGRMFLDAMKFCIIKKYEQSGDFRRVLEESRGLFIVEDQSSFQKKWPDAWGVKLHNDKYIGFNLLGRFLMELRDTGTLSYTLSADATDFIITIKNSCINENN